METPADQRSMPLVLCKCWKQTDAGHQNETDAWGKNVPINRNINLHQSWPDRLNRSKYIIRRSYLTSHACFEYPKMFWRSFTAYKSIYTQNECAKCYTTPVILQIFSCFCYFFCDCEHFRTRVSVNKIHIFAILVICWKDLNSYIFAEILSNQ